MPDAVQEAKELSKVQPPAASMTTLVNKPTSYLTTEENSRRANYIYYEMLLMGEHLRAFKYKVDDVAYTSKEYSKMRYVMVNFAALIAKISADMLVGEPPTVKAGKEDEAEGDQDFIDSFTRENKIDALLYESSVTAAALGDAVFKLRIEEGKVIVESVNPKLYFPVVDPQNVTGKTKEHRLIWEFEYNGDKYIRIESHTAGKIINKVYQIKDNKVGTEYPVNTFFPDVKPEEDTKIDEPLIVHVPNWKTSLQKMGISDFSDMSPLFYAINNRLTKIDNILDKHGDPILVVPPGIIDEKGQVKKRELGMIEAGLDAGATKPEYIVWDAKLESAFMEIEKLIESVYLIGEISPDLLGLGKGISDSGRALKYKMLRTIAKTSRKRLYMDTGVKSIYLIAQKLAKAWGASAGDVKLNGEPMPVEIDWKDGIPVGIDENIEVETKALDAGLTSKKDAIMRVYSVDEKKAEQILKEANKETAIEVETMHVEPNQGFGGSKK